MQGADETGQAEAPSAPPQSAAGEAADASSKPPRRSAPRKTARAEPPQEQAEPPSEAIPPMDWFILKVQSNREDSIRDAILRRFKIAGLEQYCDQVIVPVERVTEVKAGRKRIRKQKLYPGYVVVHMAITDDTWFLVRDTPGVGDFVGAAAKPTPLAAHEVKRILDLMKPEKPGGEEPRGTIKFAFKVGDRVKIKEGTFENFEGDVGSLDESSGKVTVMINIFGRSTPVELEYWQVEAI
jgi:transcriptional antiterminator NusG